MSEQQVDMRSFRINKDNADFSKVQEWLSLHNPFSKTGEIMSLSSGIAGEALVNCYNAQEEGMKGVCKIRGLTRK